MDPAYVSSPPDPVCSDHAYDYAERIKREHGIEAAAAMLRSYWELQAIADEEPLEGWELYDAESEAQDFLTDEPF